MATDTLQGNAINGDSVPLVYGMVTRVVANNSVLRAQADSTAHLQGLYGVVISGSVAPTGALILATNATKAKVLLETGLTPSAGQTVYVSAAAAGRATNAAPANAVAIGVIEDTSSYGLDGRVYVDVQITAGAGAGAGGAPIVMNGIQTGVNQLISLPSSGFGESQDVWVESVEAPFLLLPSSLSVDNITVVTASGKPGYQWVRQATPNRAFWAVTTWHIDSVNGSDEASGTGTGANALKTCAEWTRRMVGSIISFVEIIFDNDIPDADSLLIPCTAVNGQAFVEIAGSQTVSSTQTVASAQARTPASNLANQITVTGFDFSPFLNHFVRVQGTQNYAAITKVLTTNTANDTARLGELWNTSNSTQASSTGIGAAATIEIVTTRKGPLSIVNAGNCALAIVDVRQDGTGNPYLQNCMTQAGNAILQRYIFGGTQTGLMIGSFLWKGGLFKCSAASNVSACEMQGTAITCPTIAFQNPTGQSPIYVKVRSTVWQGATSFLASATMHIDGDLGQFDLTAGQIGISVNGAGTGEGATGNFQSGRHYGSGNNATANVWSVGVGSFVKYLTAQPPTMDAGNGVAINGGNVALGSLPVNLSLTTGSAVYAQ